MQFVTQTPDPMWGAIPLTALEAVLLERPVLTRLGQIKQMGLAFLDYPTLTHTRLEHSIGVMHVADVIFTTVRDSILLPTTERERIFGTDGGDQLRQAVRLAALLHDIGHPPFSHTVELAFSHYPRLLDRACEELAPDDPDRELFTNYSHETFTRWRINKLVSEPDIAKLLRPIMSPEVIKNIAPLAIGKAKGPLVHFNAIISGDFDADRIDYLIRDNRRSGFAIGLELDELRGAVHLRPASPPDYELYIDATALPFVNAVLAARHRLIRRVHLAPAGRAAAQMLINCLYGILAANPAGRPMHEVIIGLHTDCTDFTFYHELRRMSHKAVKATNELDAYFIKRFAEVALQPSRRSTWKEVASVSFMEMHPCVRLLAHIAEAGDWESPSELTFRRGNDGKELLFLEPSARPAQWSALMVDYAAVQGDYADGDPDTAAYAIARPPNLDFVGSTENRVGRAILVQSASNLDGYLYALDGAALGDVQDTELPDLQELAADEKVADYIVGLSAEKQQTVAALVRIGTQQREKWSVEKWGMLAADFTILVLYALDQHVRERWPNARDPYVYGAERFVNKFLASLHVSRDTAAGRCFPEIFEASQPTTAPINQKRVFSQIQRLAAYGLVTTLGNSAYRRRSAGVTGATRYGVYTTREEIQINAYGRYYVEHELLRHPKDHTSALIKLVASRQAACVDDLEELANIGARIEAYGHTSLTKLENLDKDRSAVSTRIHDARGCAMTFTLPAPSVTGTLPTANGGNTGPAL